MNTKPFKKQQRPNKFWFISVNNLFYSGKQGELLVQEKEKSFKFFNEEQATDVFTELKRRYAPINGVVKINVFERKERPVPNDKQEKKVFVTKKPRMSKPNNKNSNNE